MDDRSICDLSALDERALRPRDSAASLAMKIDHAFVK